MRNRLLISLAALLACSACNELLVYSQFRPIGNGEWGSDSPVHFELPPLDPNQAYSLFIHVRNDNDYPFSNLFLIAELEAPDGNTVKDTLEYRMADPMGNWLGKGHGGIVENKLWYREKIVFPDSGVYKVTVSHAMRKNGEVQGLSTLEGITDLGLEIEKVSV